MNGQKLDATAVGESTAQGDIYTYDQVRTALTNAATSADDLASTAILPSLDPTGGTQFFIAGAEEKALGLLPAGQSGVDGWVGLSSGTSFSFDPNNRAASGLYDAIGILEHEITEVLGRTSGVGSTLTNNSTFATALDLFRYTSAGHLAPKAASGAYFSVDGQHMLYAFNNPSNGGDSGDWADSVGADSFTEAGTPGALLSVSSVDLRELDLLGYTLNQNAAASSHVPLDFNGDGMSDILWMNASSGQISEWWGTAQGFHQNAVTASAASGWGLAASADFNGDGKADLLWFNPTSHAISEWRSTGSGFAQNAVYATVPAGWAVAGVGDFNGDGKSDLAWFNSQTHAVSVWTSTGSGFTQNTYYASVPAGWTIAAVGDFNGDHKSDILWFNSQTNAVSEWQSNGSGFSSVYYANVPSGWSVAGAGDLHGAGLADVLWFNAQTNAVSEWQPSGNAYSSFTQNTYYATVPAGWTVADVGAYVGGVDNSILWFNASSHAISQWVGESGSGFEQNAYYASVAAGWTPLDNAAAGGLYMF